VKVVRNGEAGLSGAYASVKDGQLFLIQVTIPRTRSATASTTIRFGTRRLLMHKREIS
jgi:tmRNA-binding protein